MSEFAPKRDVDDCPFSYPPGQEPPAPVHKQIGTCTDCSEPAYVHDDEGRTLCWACAMSRAN